MLSGKVSKKELRRFSSPGKLVGRTTVSRSKSLDSPPPADSLSPFRTLLLSWDRNLLHVGMDARGRWNSRDGSFPCFCLLSHISRPLPDRLSDRFLLLSATTRLLSISARDGSRCSEISFIVSVSVLFSSFSSSRRVVSDRSRFSSSFSFDRGVFRRSHEGKTAHPHRLSSPIFADC